MKSRQRIPDYEHHQGGYQIIDSRNIVVDGKNFELSADDVEMACMEAMAIARTRARYEADAKARLIAGEPTPNWMKYLKVEPSIGVGWSEWNIITLSHNEIVGECETQESAEYHAMHLAHDLYDAKDLTAK
jgi:hypothetical protein